MTWDARPRDPQEQRGFDAIGAMIRRRRHALGWSQRLLETWSGIDQTVISRLENGKQFGLRWSRFAKLVDVLGGLDGEPPRPFPTPESARLEMALPKAERAGRGKRLHTIDLGAGLAYDRDLDE